MHRVDNGRVGCCVEIHATGLSQKQIKKRKENKAEFLF